MSLYPNKTEQELKNRCTKLAADLAELQAAAKQLLEVAPKNNRPAYRDALDRLREAVGLK